MIKPSSQRQQSYLSRLELFLALSRTPHGLLDMTTPCLAALLWLGAFPPFKVILVGLLTVFAGYSAVYALNDLIDYRSDKKKMEEGLFQDSDSYLDAKYCQRRRQDLGSYSRRICGGPGALLRHSGGPLPLALFLGNWRAEHPERLGGFGGR